MGLGSDNMGGQTLVVLPMMSEVTTKLIPIWGLCLGAVSECSTSQGRPVCVPGAGTAGDRAEKNFLLKNSSSDPGLYEFLHISLGLLFQPLHVLTRIGISSSDTSKQKQNKIIKSIFICKMGTETTQ